MKINRTTHFPNSIFPANFRFIFFLLLLLFHIFHSTTLYYLLKHSFHIYYYLLYFRIFFCFQFSIINKLFGCRYDCNELYVKLFIFFLSVSFYSEFKLWYVVWLFISQYKKLTLSDLIDERTYNIAFC